MNNKYTIFSFSLHPIPFYNFMRKFISLSLLSGGLLGLLASCDNELDINADYEEIAVVYGLLDPKLDTQWVRIERGWLGTMPASASFDQPDSLYYASLTAELIEYDASNVEVARVPLIRDENARQRNDNGPFTQNAYRIYRTDGSFSINPRNSYEVRIEREGIEPIVRSTTGIILAENTSGAGEEDVLDIRTPRRIPNSPQPPTFNGDFFEWEANTGYSAEGFYEFHYTELDLTTREKTQKFFVKEFGKIISEERNNRYEYRFNTLYADIANNIEENDNVVRFFRRLKFKVTVADRTLDTYVELNVPTTSIIQSRPEFTNIENGIGIFSSRTSAQIDSIVLTSSNYTTLAKSDPLCALRFAIIKAATGDTVICDFIANSSNGEQPYTQ